jgi:hypothetical protein
MAQPSGHDRLAGLLSDVRAAIAFRYDAHDSLGNRMDTAKVIPSPAGGYLAVYHSGQVCHLGYLRRPDAVDPRGGHRPAGDRADHRRHR